jgi:hypothetical protein
VDRVYEVELLSYVAVILEWKFKKTKDVHGIDDEGNFY